MQCDSLEFLLILFKNIKLEIENKELLVYFKKIFEGKTKDSLRCNCDPSISSPFLKQREDQFMFLNVRLEARKGSGCMEDSLKNYFNSYVVNKRCDKCRSIFENEIRIKEIPQYLIIKIQNHKYTSIADVYEINLEKFLSTQIRNDFFSLKGIDFFYLNFRLYFNCRKTAVFNYLLWQ